MLARLKADLVAVKAYLVVHYKQLVVAVAAGHAFLAPVLAVLGKVVSAVLAKL